MTTDLMMIDPEQVEEQSRLLDGIATRLQSLADKRVASRSSLEQRWLEDTRQHNGEYDPDISSGIAKGKSRAFYNGTRKLCNLAEARWGEMVLPTDDRNWSIQPTPIPDIPGLDAKQLQAEAKKRALKMQRIIDDQLAEADYNRILRRVIADAVRLGTGILKGPVVTSKSVPRYQQQQIFPGVTQAARIAETQFAPTVERVSPWDFFPDDSADRIEHSESNLQRHRLNRKQLRELAKLPGFDSEALERVLSRKPGWRADGSVNKARSADYQDSTELNKYQVWEFHGVVPESEGQTLCGCNATEVTIWFCDNEILKAAPADGHLRYAVICWDEDEHGIFGSGLPRRIRGSQREANSLLRLRLDHAAMAALPQYVAHMKGLRPASGGMELAPGKLWLSDMPLQGAPIVAVTIPAMIGDLQAQFEKAVQRMEDESGLPTLAQTGDEPQVTQTATGTAMLMNSASSGLRRLVRAFDDNITRPVIRALYAWNMEFSDDDEAKGDYDIVPLGSVSLLVREQQTQGLVQLAQLAGSMQPFAQLVKWPELFRQIVASQGLNADGVTKTEEEMQAEAEAQQNQPQQPSVEQMKLQIEQAKLQLAQAELQARQQLDQQRLAVEQGKLQVAAQDSENDLRRAELAASTSLSNQQLTAAIAQSKLGTDLQLRRFDATARMGELKVKEDAANQRFNAELLTKAQMGSGI
ncbi:portal protein [Chitinilyticum litopenaei]|uniref:portal protein n=1 Tax=Chitinilyticum litopenaei TaxID=1121276 RepID=UPI000400728E|nr:hypothetical protein [Chitinilyticum litopenaei]